MKSGTYLKIKRAWMDNESEYPDKSTEFLLQLKADKCEVEVDQVVEVVFGRPIPGKIKMV